MQLRDKILDFARSKPWRRRSRRLEDFRYDEIQAKYWDTTTGLLLSAASVDGAVPKRDWPTTAKGKLIRPSVWINDVDTGLTVESSTWAPGEPSDMRDVVASERGFQRIGGSACYNTYIGAEPRDWNGREPAEWIDHCDRLWGAECEHFFDYLAHAIRSPGRKINHGIVLSGVQGIGKDTALLPVRRAIGEWNVSEVGPDDITSDYNGYVRSVLLIINEVRPHDESFKASNFYNLLKPLLSTPPEMIPMKLKYYNAMFVKNIMHVILTTNDPLSMFVPPDDRRLYFMTSRLMMPPGGERYFEKLHKWMIDGGCDEVEGWLRDRNLVEIESKPPPFTTGKGQVMGSSQHIRRNPLDDAFEGFIHDNFDQVHPAVFFLKDLYDYIIMSDTLDESDVQLKALNSKTVHFKLSERGYDMHRCPDKTEWRNGNYRSRLAFIRRDANEKDPITAIYKELKQRPLAIRAAAPSE